jgi:hypothetical protein
VIAFTRSLNAQQRWQQLTGQLGYLPWSRSSANSRQRDSSVLGTCSIAVRNDAARDDGKAVSEKKRESNIPIGSSEFLGVQEQRFFERLLLLFCYEKKRGMGKALAPYFRFNFQQKNHEKDNWSLFEPEALTETSETRMSASARGRLIGIVGVAGCAAGDKKSTVQ